MTPPPTRWIGAFGEGYVEGVLQSRGYRTVALQTASGHGVDLIGVKEKYGRTMLIVIEVKSSYGKRVPPLSADQKDLATWARQRLVAAANGRGGYRALSSQQRGAARRLLKLVETGMPAAVIVVGVRNVGKQGPPEAEIVAIR